LLEKDDQFYGAVLVLKDITRLTDLESKLGERRSVRNIVGKSAPMQKVFSLLGQLADVDTTTLVTGESGTGKELIVDALHYGGARADGPLVKVNCAGLPDSLLESDLFGHVRGAFTGAVRDKIGRFQAAEGGTIFLDEVGDISTPLQLKLLRVLEQKEYVRLGETGTRTADVRVVAATNAKLLRKVEEGVFREDLFYRLKVMCIDLPPLRKRIEDIPLLVDHFVGVFNDRFGKQLSGVTDEVMEHFIRYPWPGNVRELKHVIEHGCILCNGGRIESGHLPPELLTYRPSAAMKRGGKSSGRVGAQAVLDALREAEGNKARAARRLGIGRVTLYRKIKEYGLTDTISGGVFRKG
jgi:transcriptional regulator with PAS, ATPase and Fis domain